MTPRAVARKGFTQGVRLTLVEDDLDQFDSSLADMANELKAIKNVLIGLLISVTTAAVVLALNLATGS